MKTQNAIIESASITIQRGSFLSIGLMLEIQGGYGQGFAFGYCQGVAGKIEANPQALTC